jgi:hypothetical protein
MRKFLVRNFVLDYTIKLFGKHYNAPRGSRIIFPLFVITGIANILNDDYPTPNGLVWVLYFLVALALFFGFVYFRIYPVKFNELDDFQKLQYGYAPFVKLTPNERKEWLKLVRKYEY